MDQELIELLKRWRILGAGLLLSETDDGAYHLSKYGKRQFAIVLKKTADILDRPSGKAQGGE